MMADCGSLADAQQAADAGCDILSTTLAGYTGDRVKTDGPDFELLSQMVSAFPDFPCSVKVESTLPSTRQVIDAGAWAAVVGTAITHPTTITSWFRDAVEG